MCGSKTVWRLMCETVSIARTMCLVVDDAVGSLRDRPVGVDVRLPLVWAQRSVRGPPVSAVAARSAVSHPAAVGQLRLGRRTQVHFRWVHCAGIPWCWTLPPRLLDSVRYLWCHVGQIRRIPWGMSEVTWALWCVAATIICVSAWNWADIDRSGCKN